MKAGFITFVGRPNVGKSTLLNMFVGEKVAIMSPKAQTTRTMIEAVKTTEDAQIIIIDTPGVHKPQDALGTFMNNVVQVSHDGVDIIALLLPANESIGKGDQFILDTLVTQKCAETKLFAIVTKTDLVTEEKLMKKLIAVSEFYNFDEIIPVSSKNKKNLDTLEKVIIENLPESPFLYPTDQVSNQSSNFVISEFIREKVLHLTEEEIPHAVAIEVEKVEEIEGEMHIDAAIIVERSSQKGIIIGKQGSMIKEIRQQSERDLRRHFDKKVYVTLWVKVEKNWRSKEKYLNNFGYNKKDY